jgi:hypothetical protein
MKTASPQQPAAPDLRCRGLRNDGHSLQLARPTAVAGDLVVLAGLERVQVESERVKTANPETRNQPRSDS